MHARGVVTSILVAFTMLFLVACGGDDTVELREWTLHSPSSESDVDVTLPRRVDRFLGKGRETFTLRTRAKLPEAWRGKPVTLTIPFLKAPTSLSVDGLPTIALETNIVPNHPSLSAHRFRIDPSETRAGAIDLELTIDRDARSGGWLHSTPRLSAAPEGDTTFVVAKTLNGPVALATYAVLSMIGFTYFVLYWFDRRRTVHVWFALQAVGAAYFALEMLGIPAAVGAPPFLYVYMMNGSALASVYFVHAYFRLGAPHVVFRVLPVVVIVAAVFGCRAFPSPILLAVPTVLSVAAVPYQLVLLARLYRQGKDRFSAAMLFGAWVVLAVTAPTDALWTAGYGELAGGAHTLVVGLALYSVAQAAVLGRDHVRSLRAADALNVELQGRVAMLEERDRENRRLEAELRHQIAERSQRLADALARIGAVPERSIALAPGDEVHGRYVVKRPLGTGGMGAVHEVERIADGRRLALKVLTSASTGTALARLAREAQIAAQASHENLVAIVDVDVSEAGALYLVMELVTGAPLHDLSARFGDATWARGILRQVALGLAALHAHGVVHRDLKPGNVLITPEGVAKIADFGIARLGAGSDTTDPLGATLAHDAGSDPAHDPTLGAADLALTKTGALMGTPLYMAPELARGARSAGPSSDVWSFGVIAYEIVERRFPFAVPPVLDALAGRTIPRVLFENAALTAGERAILQRCLDADGAARPLPSEIANVLGAAA